MPVKITELVAVINARTQGFQRGVNEVVAGANRMHGSFLAAASKIASVASRITLGVTAVGTGAVFAARKFAAAAEQQIDATRKLEAVFKATGNAAGLTVQQVEQFAAARQSVTNFGDEVTLQGAAVLATFKNIREQAFFRTLSAAQDVSVTLGTDLQGAVLQLGKALNDPVTGLTMLNRVGITFSKTQQEMIKGLAEQGRLFEAQGLILKEVESQFGGTAQAVSRPWQRFLNVLSDVAENIGSALVPVFDAIGGVLSELTGPLAGNASAFEQLGESWAAFIKSHKQEILDALHMGLRVLADAGRRLWTVIEALWPIFVDLQPVLSTLAELLAGGLALGFKALTPIIRVAAKGIEAVAGAINFVIQKAKELLGLSDEALLKEIEKELKSREKLEKAIQSKSDADLRQLIANNKDPDFQAQVQGELDRRAQAAQEQRPPSIPVPANIGGMPAAGDATSSAPPDFAAAVAAELKNREQSAFNDQVQAEADRVTGADVAAQQEQIQQAFAAAGQQTIEFGAHLDSLRDKLPREQLDGFAQAAVGMTNAVRDGRLTSDQFADAMGRLRAATDSAVDAAEKKAEQERRAALLRGDFAGAGLDLQAAAQEKIAQFRMRAFDEQAQALANRMLGLDQITTAVNTGMERLNGGVQRVTDAFEDAADRVQKLANPEQVREAQRVLGSFMSSVQGQISLLKNRIALESQPLQLKNLNPGRREEIEERLARLRSQLDALMTAPPPITTGLSGDPVFRDPGLQGGVQIVNQMEFPNVTRLNNDDIRRVYDQLTLEIQRRGVPMTH